MTRDCPQPKNYFVDFDIESVLMGSPVLSVADLCARTTFALVLCHSPLGVCHEILMTLLLNLLSKLLSPEMEIFHKPLIKRSSLIGPIIPHLKRFVKFFHYRVT